MEKQTYIATLNKDKHYKFGLTLWKGARVRVLEEGEAVSIQNEHTAQPQLWFGASKKDIDLTK